MIQIHLLEFQFWHHKFTAMKKYEIDICFLDEVMVPQKWEELIYLHAIIDDLKDSE